MFDALSPLAKPSSGVPDTSSAAGREGPLHGQVVAEDGRPVAGIKVTAYLSGVTPQAPYRIAAAEHRSPEARRLAAGTEVRTDDQGRFVLDPNTAGTYNVEAVQNDDSKAWKSKVTYAGAGSQAAVGQLKLAPVGRISGRVRSAVSTVSDFSNTQVYIPGSSYIAITKADGSYTISNVPAGSFELGAFNVDLGDGALPDAEFTQPIRVLPSEVTEVPAIVLATRPPEFTQVTRTRTLEVTDNGAAGQEIDLHGKNFGFNRGTKLTVQFSGSVLQAPERLSEELIRAKVPKDANNGVITVIVGNLPSEALDFRVMRSFTVASTELSLKEGETYELAIAIDARDADNAKIVEVRDGDLQRKARANIDWASDQPNVGIILDRGVFKALSEGAVTLTAGAGELPQVKVAVTIAPGTPGQSSTPSPSATTGATPTPAPSGSPLTGGAALLAVNPAIANTGQTVYLEGAFGPTATVHFPGGAQVAATVLGTRRAKVLVPANVTAGSLTVTTAGVTTAGLPFRVPSFTLGLAGGFHRAYDQTAGARQMPTLVTARDEFGSAVVGNYLYILGGNSGPDLGSVERAAIDAAGKLGAFEAVGGSTLIFPRRQFGTAVIGDSLYVFGGYSVAVTGNVLDSVERASIDSGGNLGAFQVVEGVTLATKRYGLGSAVVGGYLYVFSGRDAGPLTSVERAQIGRDGSLGAFQTVAGANLATARFEFGSAVVGGYLYAFGGWNESGYLATVERATIGSDGDLGAFGTVAGVNFVTARESFRSAILGSNLYVFGGYNRGSGEYLGSVERAAINANGDLGAFQTVSGVTLATPRRSFGSAIIGNDLYAFGGRSGDTTRQGDVERTGIDVGGDLGAFQSASGATLTAGRTSFCSAMVGRYLYVLGGSTGEAGAAAVTSVERAGIDVAGNLGALQSLAGVTLRSARAYFGCAVVGNYLYAFGGGPAPLKSSVERASIDASGNLANFETVSNVNLVTPRLYFGSVVLGRYLYVVGGIGDGGVLNGVERASIGTDGNLSAFQTATATLATGRRYFGLAVAGPYVYILGGCGASANLNSVERAAFDAEGNLGAFQTVEGVTLVKACNPSGYAVIGDSLYVLGGAASGILKQIWRARIDKAGNLSTFEASGELASPRAEPAAAVIGDWLYVLGGYGSSGNLNTIERARLE